MIDFFKRLIQYLRNLFLAKQAFWPESTFDILNKESTVRCPKLGWMRDLPDIRDYSVDTPKVQETLKMYPQYGSTIPDTVDLRQWCSPIEDQQALGSCTANAAVGAVELLQRAYYGNHIDMSRLFVYKTTRNLMQRTGDTGATIRGTMKALAMFGSPPEQYWDYDIQDFDLEPSQFAYAMGQNYKAISYYRLDPQIKTTEAMSQTVQRIQQQLAWGIPCVFGFIVFYSVPRPGDGKIDIPMPTPGDYPMGGHAVLAVGYDNNRMMPTTTPGKSVKGAFLIRNSWGTSWGDGGYGWLPYSFVRSGLAVDWWALAYTDHIDLSQFDTRR